MKILGVLASVGTLCLLLGIGCASKQPGSSSQAYIQITNQTTESIVTAAVAVCAANGYALTARSPGMLVFDRPASRADAFKYGDWINDGMVMEIKMRITELDSNITLLQADVYAVQDPNDAFFRTETKTISFDHRPYQKMLNEIRDRLEKEK